VALLFAGMMNSITNGPVLALLQGIISPDMQGRVFTVVGSLTGLASPLGLTVAGPVADALGVGAWFTLGGIACTLMGVAGLNVPAVVNIEGGRPASAESDTADIAASEHEILET
jgi:DHA3 family macrolide efflux protein-like MFS transporter